MIPSSTRLMEIAMQAAHAAAPVVMGGIKNPSPSIQNVISMIW